MKKPSQGPKHQTTFQDNYPAVKKGVAALLLIFSFSFVKAQVGDDYAKNILNVLSYLPAGQPDGITDNTFGFNAAIAAWRAGGKKARIYIPGAVNPVTGVPIPYRTAQSYRNVDIYKPQGILLDSNLEIYGDGASTVIRALNSPSLSMDTTNSKWWPMFNGYYKSVANVYIHDLTIDGNNRGQVNFSGNPFANPTTLFYQPGTHYAIDGILFYLGTNNRVERITANDCQDRGVHFIYSNYGSVKNSYFSGDGGGGITYSISHFGEASWNHMDSNYSDNIRIEEANYCKVVHNISTYAGRYAGGTPNYAGIYLEDASYTTVEDNQCTFNAGNGIDVAYYTTPNVGEKIMFNYSARNGEDGISMKGAGTIQGNNFYANANKTLPTPIDTNAAHHVAIFMNSSGAEDNGTVISGNSASDTTAGRQHVFMKGGQFGGGAIIGNTMKNDTSGTLYLGEAYDARNTYSGNTINGLPYTGGVTDGAITLYQPNTTGVAKTTLIDNSNTGTDSWLNIFPISVNANVNTAVQIIPKGTGTAELILYGDDANAQQSNRNWLSIKAQNNLEYDISTKQSGGGANGTQYPLIFQGNTGFGVNGGVPATLSVNDAGGGGSGINIKSTGAATTSYSLLQLVDQNGDVGQAVLTNSTYTPSGLIAASQLGILNTGAGGIYIAANNAAGLIKLVTGGFTNVGLEVFANSTVAIGSTTDNSSGKLQVTSTATQAAFHYDATHLTQFATSSAGDFTITPSNSNTTIIGSLNVSAQMFHHIVLTSAGTYTIQLTDYTVVATGTTSTWTFPSAATGRVLDLVNQGSGAITLGTAVTTASGTTTTTLAAGSNFIVQYDGTVWRKIN